MPDDPVEAPEDPFGGATVSCEATAVLGELRARVREAAEPAVPGERVGAAILRASRNLGIAYSRARAHWYGLARSAPAWEADQIRAAYHRWLDAREAQLDGQLETLRARRMALREGEDRAVVRAADAGDVAGAGGDRGAARGGMGRAGAAPAAPAPFAPRRPRMTRAA